MSAALAVLAAEIRTQEEWVSKERTRISTNPETDKIPGRATRGRGNASVPQYHGGMAEQRKKLEDVYFRIGSRIGELVNDEKTGVSRAELSRRMGMTRGAITRIIAGERRVMAGDLERFAEAFSLPIKTFLKGIWL